MVYNEAGVNGVSGIRIESVDFESTAV